MTQDDDWSFLHFGYCISLFHNKTIHHFNLMSLTKNDRIHTESRVRINTVNTNPSRTRSRHKNN